MLSGQQRPPLDGWKSYNAAGQLLGRYTTSQLGNGTVETMRVARGTADIAYAIASGHAVGAVRLDNLQFGARATTVLVLRESTRFLRFPLGPIVSSPHLRLLPH